MPKIIKKCTNCGNNFSVKQSDINRGRGRFCSKRCAASGRNSHFYKHGHTIGKQSKEYMTWAGIKSRVKRGNILNRKYYKDRGITMCDRWFNSFENFLLDVGKAPGAEYEIDRIDVNGNYEPLNCRWVTHTEQMNNIRSNKVLNYKGVSMTQAQWGQKFGLSGRVIHKRLKRGWSLRKALNTPLGSQKNERFIKWKNDNKPIREWAKLTGLSRELISYRLDRAKMSVEEALTKRVLR